MKKILTALTVGVVMATGVFADINIQWTAGAGFYSDAGGSVELLSGGNTALAQLIFTPSGVIGHGIDSAGADFIDTDSDNQLLSSFVLSAGAGGTADSLWADFGRGPDLYVGYVAPGYVYARIFQGDSPVDGMWYYNSPLMAVVNYDPLNPTYQTLQLNTDLVNGDGIYDGAANCFQTIGVVPEPTSMALMGVAGLLAIVRRFKKA
jgi:hypothetical protein